MPVSIKAASVANIL